MHEHDHNCGCGHEHEHEALITLTLDDDTEVECIVISIFPVGERTYIALLPTSSMDEIESEIYLYQYIEHEDDELELLNIDDDKEFKDVSKAFDELLDSDSEDDYFDFVDFEDEDDDEDVLFELFDDFDEDDFDEYDDFIDIDEDEY